MNFGGKEEEQEQLRSEYQMVWQWLKAKGRKILKCLKRKLKSSFGETCDFTMDEDFDLKNENGQRTYCDNVINILSIYCDFHHVIIFTLFFCFCRCTLKKIT